MTPYPGSMSRPENSERNCEFVMQILTRQSAELKSSGQCVINSSRNSRVAMLVEPRQHPFFEGVVRNVMYFLNGMANAGSGEWNLHVFCGTGNEVFIRDLFPDWQIAISNLGVSNISTDEHNKLLLQKTFWESIREESILVFQTDVMMFRNMPDKFLNFDMVGAHYLNPHEQNVLGQGFNGGFNLRKKTAVLDCLAHVTLNEIAEYRRKHDRDVLPSVKYTGKVAEDVFYTQAMAMLSKHLPTKEEACQFSTEALYNIESVGIHAFNKTFFPFKQLVDMVKASELSKYL